MIDASEITARQIRHDHPDWKQAEVWLEVMRATTGQGDYANTYREARKYGIGALRKDPRDTAD